MTSQVQCDMFFKFRARVRDRCRRCRLDTGSLMTCVECGSECKSDIDIIIKSLVYLAMYWTHLLLCVFFLQIFVTKG